MNELWSEADAILNKALNGCSTYLLENIAASASPSSYPDSYLYRGNEFIFWPGTTHGATSTSVVYSAFETIPNTYDQSTYDTAAANATISSYANGYAYVAGSSTPDLKRSMKVHYRDNGGGDHAIWEYTEPAPEKQWDLAVAEVIIATGSGTSFAIPDSYDKYNSFKIHNLTDRDYAIYCGSFSDPHTTFSVPAYNQKCLRRVGTTFHHDYNYFFKCLPQDPRFLFFDSFSGSIAQTMRANNVTNPHFIFNLFEFVGMENSPFLQQDYNSTQGRDKHHQRIFFNSTTQNDIGSDYATGGYFPTIDDNTKIGDLVFHKGAIGYRKKDTSGSTLQTGTVQFDGWGSFNSNLNAIGAEISDSTITHNEDTNIGKTATPSLFEIWPLTTNVLQINDANQVFNLASTVYKLQTHFLKVPDLHQNTTTIGVDYTGRPKSFRPYHALFNGIATSGTNPNVSGTSFDGKTYTVGNFKTHITNYCSISTPENKSVVLTSEGPKLLWRDVFDIRSPLGGGDNEAYWKGLITNHSFSLELDSGTLKLKCDQEWFIPKRLHSATYSGSSAKGKASYLYAYTCGWPSHWKDSFFNAVTTNYRHHIDTHKFHRMHETPRKVRQYETATPITAGTETFKHNDIEGDPAGTDLQLNNIGTLTSTDIAFLTNDIDAKASKGSFSGGEVNNPNYPRLIVDDVILEVENSKTDASLNTIKNPASYNRINLVREHYNNIAVLIKKADQIRPLAVDEIYWGNRIMKPGNGWLNDRIAPVELYEGFTLNDDQYDLYLDLFGSTDKIYDYTDFADGTAIRNAAATTTRSDQTQSERDDVDDFRWVKISDVQEFAKNEKLDFRFEEVSAPAYWTTSLSQTSQYGITSYITNTFVNAISGTSHNYKISTGTTAMLTGQHYGQLGHSPITDDIDEQFGTTFYTKLPTDFGTYGEYFLQPSYKSNIDGGQLPISLIIQIVDGLNPDGSSKRTNNPRGKLAIHPLKKCFLAYPNGNPVSGPAPPAPNNYPSHGEDTTPTDSAALQNITADTTYFYPNEARHRYAFLVNTTAAKTHSA